MEAGVADGCGSRNEKLLAHIWVDEEGREVMLALSSLSPFSSLSSLGLPTLR